MPTQTEVHGALGTETVLGSNSDLSALANNALFLSAAYNNTPTNPWASSSGNGGGARFCRITATLTMAVAATANTDFSIWFLKSQDGGTTYEAGGTGYTPLRLPDCVFPAPVDTTQRIVMRDIPCPVGYFKVLIKNNGTGQALKTDTGSTGSKLTITPFARVSQ